MASMRCVEVNFGEVGKSPEEVNRALHKAMAIQHKNRGLGWEYGETRPFDDIIRVVY